MRRLADGKSEPVDFSHPAQQLLNHINSNWTLSDLMVGTETNLSLWGSAFWFLNRSNPTGPVDSIFLLRSDRVRVVSGRPLDGSSFDEEDYIVGFELNVGAQRIPLSTDEVVWLRYYNPLDEFAGLSPIAAARRSLDMGKDATTFNAKFFENSTIPMDMVFQTDHHMTDDQIKEFYIRLEKRMKGAANAHRPMIWDGTVGDIKKLGLSQRDMEFLASLQWTVEDAARVYGVPMPLMMSQEASTFSNLTESRTWFYSGTIDPEWKFIEDELNEGLLSKIMPASEARNLFVQFDRSLVIPLQDAMAASDTRNLAEIKNGVMTINEYRTLKGREPVAWGDAWWIPGAMVPVTDAETIITDANAEAEGRGYKAFSDAALDAVSKNFATRQDAGVRTFNVMQRDLFEKQRRETLRRIANLAPSSVLESVKDKSEIDGVVTRQGGVFHPEEWIQTFKNEGERLIAAMLITEARAHAEEFGLGAIEAETPEIAAWVEQRTNFWATRVNATTAKMIVEEMTAAFVNEESIPEIQARINKLFGFNDIVRSERIARTEMLGAANQGHLEAYRQSGVVEEKMWLSTLDMRIRSDPPPGYNHLTVHRDIVPVDSKFIVSGEMLDAPGVGGSAGNVINCRCTVAPVIKSKKGFRALPSKSNSPHTLTPADEAKASEWLHSNGVTNGHRNGG